VTQTGWSDERLRAGFRRAAGSAAVPGDLVFATTEAVRGTRRPIRWALPQLRAAATVLAIVVFAIGIGARLTSDQDQPPSSPSTHGLPILTVAGALAKHDAGSSEEMAVRGYLSPAPDGVRCPPPIGQAINPIRLDCPRFFAWLLDSPTPLEGIGAALPAGRIGFHPVFPGLNAPAMPQYRPGTAPLSEVVLIGHFHDRRNIPALCDSPDPGVCDSFVVDGVVEVDGTPQPVSTLELLEPLGNEPRHEPRWTASDADAAAHAIAPGLDVLSRVAIAGHRIAELEPALGTGALSIIDQPVVWLINGLEHRANEPARLRTLLLVDGSGEAFEAVDWTTSNVGWAPISTPRPSPTATETPAPATPEPSKPDSAVAFPDTVLGLDVISVSEALEILARTDQEAAGPHDVALAVRGWYAAPTGPMFCPMIPANLPPLELRCPDGYLWLMEREQSPFGAVDGVTEWRTPEGPALHPIIRAGVPFPVLADELDVRPVPVVVIGHFFDPRAQLWEESKRFVVDALAWQRNGPVEWNLVPLGGTPSEDPAAVEARVERQAGAARASWGIVTTGARAGGLDALGSIGGLTDATTVWRFRRLVETGGVPVVRTAYAVDGTNRVYVETEGGWARLLATGQIQLSGAGARGLPLDLFDAAGIVVAARSARPGEPSLVSPRIVPGPETVGEVAIENPGGRLDELWIGWSGSACDTAWSLSIGGPEPSIYLEPAPRQPCDPAAVGRGVLLVLSRPVRASDVIVITNPMGG